MNHGRKRAFLKIKVMEERRVKMINIKFYIKKEKKSFKTER